MTSKPRDIHLCPLCLKPLLSTAGRAIPCACDDAERLGLALPDDQLMTNKAYRCALTDYQAALRQAGLML